MTRGLRRGRRGCGQRLGVWKKRWLSWWSWSLEKFCQRSSIFRLRIAVIAALVLALLSLRSRNVGHVFSFTLPMALWLDLPKISDVDGMF